MSPTKHLVVGMNGTIGSALYSRLQATGAAVWGTTQRRTAEMDDHTIYLNLREPASWPLSHKFDVVYFCAGLCRMSLCEEDPVGTHQVNVDATLALAQYFAAHRKLVIFLSTNQVFGNQSFVLPDAEYQPQNEYGRQKAKIEGLLKEHCPKLAIVRLTKVVEPNMALIQNWMQRLQQEQTVDAFTDMMLAPVSLRQVVNVLEKIGTKNLTGIYQVSGNEDISYYDLAKFLATQLNCSASLVRAVSGAETGMRKTFLPKFTTLDTSSIIAAVNEHSPHYAEVVQECFDLV